jgi:hypothetical protein
MIARGGAPAPTRMPWAGALVPHATLEVNHECNLDCDGCYKDKSSGWKPLAQLEGELEVALGRRRLQSLTLAGGEPTLHPELPAVIALVARRGVDPMLLTNGTLLTPERLVAYRAAGLRRVAIHVDSRQRGRPDAPPAACEADLNPLRRALAARCAAAGLECTLVITAYRDTLPGLRDVVELCLSCDAVTALLATGYSEAIDRRRRGTAGQSVDNRMLRDAMRDAFGAEPAWFIPSERDPMATRWLFYQCGITSGSAGPRTLWWDPRDRVPLWLLPRLDGLLRGRYRWDMPMSWPHQASLIALQGVTLARPATLARTVAFLGAAARNRRLKTCSIVFQEAPALRPGGGADPCRDCPDATVRNGELVPICLADQPKSPA